MPSLNIVTLIVLAAGAILIYSAVTDRNPIEVVKSALQGKVAKSGFSKEAKAGDGNSSSGGGSF